jgi:Bacterial Ig-like domain (group 2)
MRTPWIWRGLTLAICAACGSSSDAPTDPNAPALLTLKAPNGSNTFAMKAGTTAPLTVTVRTAAGIPLPNAGTLQFTSRNTTVVTIDQTGVVTAKSDGASYVVASLTTGNRTLSDSVGIVVSEVAKTDKRP